MTYAKVAALLVVVGTILLLIGLGFGLWSGDFMVPHGSAGMAR